MDLCGLFVKGKCMKVYNIVEKLPLPLFMYVAKLQT